MKFVLSQPTLQHLSLVNSAISLWRFHSHIYADWECTPTYKQDWKSIEDKMCAQISHLAIPHILKPRLKKFTRHVGLELRDFLKYLHTQNPFAAIALKLGATKCIELTKWTPHGKLDVPKTAETFVQLDELAPRDRYILACMFCAVATIHAVWRPGLATEFRNKHPIFNFWDYVMSRDMDPTLLKSSNKSMLFLKAIDERNESVVRYLWSILNPDEKTSFLDVCLDAEFRSLVEQTSINRDKHGNGIIYFLLSQMNEKQLDFVLLSHIRLSFIDFLLSDLIYVQFLVSSVERVLQMSSKDEYYLLYLLACYTGMCETVSACFSRMWRKVTREVKQRVTEGDTELASFCVRLCKSRDLVNIELIFGGVSVELRRRTLSRCLYHFIRQRGGFSWDFLHLVARRCITDEEEMRIFKKSCVYSSFKICTSLFTKRESEWVVMDRFLRFSFGDEAEIVNFKKSLAFNTVYERYLPKNEDFYDRFLDWCCFTQQEISDFKLTYF